MGHENKHGHYKMEMPDYRQWKIEGTPLEAVQKKLARRGLRDPWLRNEAWRFTGEFAKSPGWWAILGTGFKYGFAAFVVALAVEHAVKKFWLKNKDHEHH